MTGMIAVIAHNRRDTVCLEEIEALVSTYQSLRGSAVRHDARAGTFARLVKLDSASALRPGIEHRTNSWAAVCGAAYPEGSFLDVDASQLDGQFGAVRYDGQCQRLEVFSDPFANFSLYRAERGGKTYISTSALTLARHLRAAPDDLGLSLLLRTGQQFGPLTNWEGIVRLDPATALTFSDEGCRHSTYWRLAVDETVARMRFPAVVDHLIGVLTEQLQRYAGRPGVLSDLTGGYDTRLLTVLLDHAGIHFDVNTVGAPHTTDVRLARQVASAGGWTWGRFRVPTDWTSLVLRELPSGLAWSDGRLPAIRVAEVLWTHQRKSRAHHALLAGGGGTVFRGHAWRQEFFNAGRTTEVNYNRLIGMMYNWADHASLYAAPEPPREQAYLRTLLEKRAEPYRSALNTVQLDAILAYQSTAWEGVFGSAAGAHLVYEMPFYFKAAYAAGFSIAHHYRNDHQVMRAIIERLHPRIAALPTTAGGPARLMKPSNLWRFAPYYGDIARATVNKLSPSLRNGGLFARHVPDDPRIACGRLAVLRHMRLNPATMASASFYNRAALDAFLRQSATPDPSTAAMIDRMITVELLMRGDSTYRHSLESAGHIDSTASTACPATLLDTTALMPVG